MTLPRPSRVRQTLRRSTRRAISVIAVGSVTALVALGLGPVASSAATIGTGDCTSTVSDGLTTLTGTNSTAIEGTTLCVVVFTAGTGTWTVPAGLSRVNVQMVAGGGGGGNFGGGGGGETIIRPKQLVVTGGASLDVTVGEGGTGGQPGALPTNGSDSVFGSLITKGGGAGGSVVDPSSPGGAGSDGGSGGGGAPSTTGDTGGAGGATTKTAGQDGNGGGAGKGETYPTGLTAMAGGGGGGSLEAGKDGRVQKFADSGSLTAGAGGFGSPEFEPNLSSAILPPPEPGLGVGTQIGVGGGAGIAAFGPTTTLQLALNSPGPGGGGWANDEVFGTAQSGRENYGQGGGGGGRYDWSGGDGGSGLVVVFYPQGGGGGGGTGGPKVTSPEPKSASGTTPVVFDVLPTIAAGANPVNFAATCIVDPVTSACGTTVTSPTEGEWVLDLAAGTLTFTPFATATPGSTQSVVLRAIDDAGVSGEGTFSVLILGDLVIPKFTG